MLSEEAYNNLMENVHVMGTKTNYDWLMESKMQLESGNGMICEGIGKTEPLVGNLTGFWSRGINDKDRLVYKIYE